MVHQVHVRVMIVEDDAEILAEYRRLMEEHRVLQLVTSTDDPDEAFHILKTTTIDAVILELELAKGSGIILLKKLNTLLVEKPFIIVVTNVVSKCIYSAIRDLGVDYIYIKSNAKFSVSIPLSIIEICAPYRKIKERVELTAGKISTQMKEDIYKRMIEYKVSKFGFSLKMLGTAYIQEALLYLLMSGKTEISMTKEMYPYIASKFKTNSNNVERNIRIAIEKVWTDSDIRVLKELYPYGWNPETGRPTNAEFLYNIANALNIEAFDGTIK